MLLLLFSSNFLQAMDRFRGSEHGILVATDVAARGLDIPGVRTVVHYQLPHSAEVIGLSLAFLTVFFVGCVCVCVFISFFVYTGILV